MSKQTNAINEEFMGRMESIEEHFIKHKTEEDSKLLFDMYKRVIESYSQKNDPIVIYFTEKLAKLAMDVVSITENKNEDVRGSVGASMYEPAPNDIRFVKQIISPAKYDPEAKRKERTREFMIQIELRSVKKHANARTILNSYYEECVESNKIINEDLQAQRKQLEDKLAIIQKRSQEYAQKRKSQA